MKEVLIAGTLLMVLLYSNKILRQIKYFIVITTITILGEFILIKAANFDHKMMSVPIVFLIIYQPLRFLFKWILKREPIFYLRGINLNQQEEDNLQVLDYLFSALLFSISLFSQAFLFP